VLAAGASRLAHLPILNGWLSGAAGGVSTSWPALAQREGGSPVLRVAKRRNEAEFVT
jgi:hypothetical protein